MLDKKHLMAGRRETKKGEAAKKKRRGNRER